MGQFLSYNYSVFIKSLVIITFLVYVPFLISANSKVELWRKGKVKFYDNIQLAINNSLPGDSIGIKSGIYHENLVIENRSGKDGLHIKLTGPANGLVLIDGADTELQKINNNRWKKGRGNIYSTQRNYSGRQKWERVSMAGVGKKNERICTYWNKENFEKLTYGPGIYFSDNLVQIKLSEGNSPKDIQLNIGISEAVLKIVNSHFWKVSNLTFTNGGFAGVYLSGNNYSDIILSNLIIKNCYRGISTDETDTGKNVRIEACNLSNDTSRDWPWEGYEDAGSRSDDSEAPQRTCGIMIKAAKNVIVKNCKLSGWWDGMKITGENIKVYTNYIHTIYDDMIELESGSSKEIEFFDNTGCNVFVGISLINNIGGNIYVYRNNIFCTKKMTSSKSSGTYGYSIKLGGGWGEKQAENVKIYHNNFYAERANFWDARKVEFKNFAFINNIFYTRKNDSNFLNHDTLTHTSKNGNVWMNNLWNKSQVLESGAIYSEEGIKIEQRKNEVCLAFQIGQNSVIINKGSKYVMDQNWPDFIKPVGQPDIGAFER